MKSEENGRSNERSDQVAWWGERAWVKKLQEGFEGMIAHKDNKFVQSSFWRLRFKISVNSTYEDGQTRKNVEDGR